MPRELHPISFFKNPDDAHTTEGMKDFRPRMQPVDIDDEPTAQVEEDVAPAKPSRGTKKQAAKD